MNTFNLTTKGWVKNTSVLEICFQITIYDNKSPFQRLILLGHFTIMSQPIKVDFFNCANIFLVVVLVRLPVLRCAVG